MNLDRELKFALCLSIKYLYVSLLFIFKACEPSDFRVLLLWLSAHG